MRRSSATGPQSRTHGLDWLAETSTAMVELSADDDAYLFVAEKVQELIGDGIVVISEIDEQKEISTIRSLVGLGKGSKLLMDTLKRDPVGMEFPIFEREGFDLDRGEIVRLPDNLHTLTSGKLSKGVSRTVEKILGIKEIHSIDLSWEGQIFGNISLILRSPGLKEKTTIETFVRVASVLLQKRLAVEAMVDSEWRYRNLFESSPEGIAIMDTDGVIIDYNGVQSHILGLPRENVIGKTFFELGLVPEDELERLMGIFERIIAGEEVEPFEVVIEEGDVRLDLEILPGLVRKGGEIVAIQVITKDVTERNRAEHARRELEVQYSSIFEKGNDGIAVLQNDRVVFWNDRVLEITGLTEEDISTTDFSSLISPEDRKATMERYERRKRGEAVESVYEITVKGSGGSVPVEINANIIDYQGSPATLVFVRDISERARSARVLEESEEMFRLAFDHATIGRALATPEGKFVKFNQVACDMVGYTQDEILKMTWMDITHADHMQESFDLMSKLMQGRIPAFTIEQRAVRKDGNIIWVNLTVVLARDSEGDPMYIIGEMENITARKLGEMKHLESEQRYKSLFEQSMDAVYITRRDGTIVDLNPAAYALLGYSPQDIEDLPADQIYVNPEERFVFQKEIEQKGYVKDFETQFRRKDGSVIDCIITSSVRKDEKGLAIGYQGIIHDITQRKRAAALIEDSLKEKEVLLKEIHHRVKNNMQVISSMLSLQATYIEDEDMLKIFDESQNRVKSMGLIHNKLYQSADLSGVDLMEYTQTLGGQLIHSYGADASGITIRVDGSDIKLGIDRAVPVGLILNELISNSLKHAFPDGRGGRILVNFEGESGGRITIDYSDDGIGIPQDIDFRDTKSLGMELVTTLVEQIEGSIELSRDDGTRFVIGFTE